MRNLQVNGIALHIAKDYEELSGWAALTVITKIKAEAPLNVLVPTGKTPEGMYKHIRNEERNPFPTSKLFNMDEYCMKTGDAYRMYDSRHPTSYRNYMNKNLFITHCPREKYFPSEMNAEKEGLYDNLIKSEGGVDFCVTALGEDGHTFGFNFPGSPWNSRTRVVELPSYLRRINQEKTGRATPQYAITTGMATGMDSKEILALISGRNKAEILAETLYSQPSEVIPSTILKLHESCHWLVDEAAASLL